MHTVDGADARIDELERGFRRDGLPNLILGLSAADDIFTRATPFFAVVFLLEVVTVDLDAGWASMLLALGVGALLIGGFGLLNLVRGRRFFSIPHRVGVPELVAFVVLPGFFPIIFSGDLQSALVTVGMNILIVIVTYVVVGFGVISIVRWAAVSMFVVLGMVFLSVRLPTIVRDIQVESDMGDVPLRRRERLNLAAVALISQALQVLFVSAAVWLFYVVLGALLVSAEVRADWLTHGDDVIWTINWFGERVQVTEELLRVATGVAAFAGLYYAVTILTDAAYRDQFVDNLSQELRDTFARRSEYLSLVGRRDESV
jgi:hypothetical protein